MRWILERDKVEKLSIKDPQVSTLGLINDFVNQKSIIWHFPSFNQHRSKQFDAIKLYQILLRLRKKKSNVCKYMQSWSSLSCWIESDILWCFVDENLIADACLLFFFGIWRNFLILSHMRQFIYRNKTAEEIIKLTVPQFTILVDIVPL